jgi:flagellar hook assembly protein FlgD
VPQAGAGRVRILDVSGRVVRTLLDGSLPGGEQVLTWTGDADDGTLAAPGVYFVRIDWSGEGVTRRVVRLR